MDIHETRTQLLEDELKKREAVQQMLNGVRLIKLGGVEGIKVAADLAPEMLIDLIDTMTAIIDMQQTQIREHLEARFQLMDGIESIQDTLTKDSKK